MIKLFSNKKGQFAKAMRNVMASEEKEDRQIFARYYFNSGISIDQISIDLGVQPETVKKYLRDTKHLDEEQINNKIQNIKIRNYYQIYIYYLAIVYVFIPIVGFIFDVILFNFNSGYWYVFLWRHWIVGLIVLPLIYILYEEYFKEKFNKVSSTNEVNQFIFYTKINGLRHHCKPSYLEKLEKGDKLRLERDELNKYDKYAVKVINKKDGKHLGFIPSNYNKKNKIYDKVENKLIEDCYVEHKEKNPKEWLNSHTIHISLVFKKFT